MAPTRSTSSSTDSPRKSILKNTVLPRQQDSEAFFSTSKRDKRKIKHEQLMSKISKSAKPKVRRRRPNKKLVTTLDALADALPGSEEVTDSRTVLSSQLQNQVNVIKRKSIKSKPGAMKRREKIDKGERDRFAKNLAQMASGNNNTSNTADNSSKVPQLEDKWKALRGFIAQTMEKKPGIGV